MYAVVRVYGINVNPEGVLLSCCNSLLQRDCCWFIPYEPHTLRTVPGTVVSYPSTVQCYAVLYRYAVDCSSSMKYNVNVSFLVVGILRLR
jgi:hypothetical protein